MDSEGQYRELLEVVRINKHTEEEKSKLNQELKNQLKHTKTVKEYKEVYYDLEYYKRYGVELSKGILELEDSLFLTWPES